MAASGRSAPEAATGAIDRARYRRVRRFFLRALLHALWWDLVMARPVLRRFRPPAVRRWRAIAARYRELAVEMGGVLIKLGQFLSTRVDVLPREITGELAGLQDRVPPSPRAAVVAAVEAQFGRPVADVFEEFSVEPVGAASLAQVHGARLPGGERVVVKILRPGIDVLVETDLAAITQALRWLRLSRTVRRRVDVDWLLREFTLVTRRELDLEEEGRSAERFAGDFADADDVLVPRVYWSHTTARVLTLEDVGYLRIADLDALDAAGIDRAALARRLYDIYLRQFFETHFVHADPHPGNIFVRPLDGDDGATDGGRPFQIAFVDFGMVTEIPERLREGLREFAIGLGTRDARRIVQAYVAAGVLLPGADIERLVEAHEAILGHFWGVRLADIRDLALDEAPHFVLEYRDLLFQAPIQVQADMLFAMRAVGILAGLSTTIDPAFDPWAETLPFAAKLAREASGGGVRGLLDELGVMARVLLGAPGRIDRVLAQAEGGRLTVRTTPAPESVALLRRLDRSVARLSWAVSGAGLVIAGAVMHGAGGAPGPALGLLGAGAMCLLVVLLGRRR